MSLYEILLFVHVMGVILWFGSGVVFQALGERATRSGDAHQIRAMVTMGEVLGNAFYIAATLAVLASGIWMVLERNWGFAEPFVMGGIIGFVLSSVLGGIVLGPASQRVAAAVTENTGADIHADLLKLRMFGRVDTLIMATVVFLMTAKPGS